MARHLSEEDAGKEAREEAVEEIEAAGNEMKAVAMVKNNSNPFDVLTGLDDQNDDVLNEKYDPIDAMANNIERYIDELAAEREEMKIQIKYLMEKDQRRDQKERELGEKLALRDIYHAFNEKFLRMD